MNGGFHMSNVSLRIIIALLVIILAVLIYNSSWYATLTMQSIQGFETKAGGEVDGQENGQTGPVGSLGPIGAELPERPKRPSLPQIPNLSDDPNVKRPQLNVQ